MIPLGFLVTPAMLCSMPLACPSLGRLPRCQAQRADTVQPLLQSVILISWCWGGLIELMCLGIGRSWIIPEQSEVLNMPLGIAEGFSVLVQCC